MNQQPTGADAGCKRFSSLYREARLVSAMRRLAGFGAVTWQRRSARQGGDARRSVALALRRATKEFSGIVYSVRSGEPRPVLVFRLRCAASSTVWRWRLAVS